MRYGDEEIAIQLRLGEDSHWEFKRIEFSGLRPQPVHFVLGEDLRLTDADGNELLVRIVDIVGRSALLEYRPCRPRPSPSR